MRKLIVLALFIPLLGSNLKAQELKVVNAKELESFLARHSDTVYVLNFWATWCKPCLEEMPVFEKAGKQYEGQNVKIILISNDFKKQIDTRLKPYMLQKDIKNEVWWMNETDPNLWVSIVDKEWQGELPATYVFGGNKKTSQFHSGELTESELEKLIHNQQ